MSTVKLDGIVILSCKVPRLTLLSKAGYLLNRYHCHYHCQPSLYFASSHNLCNNTQNGPSHGDSKNSIQKTKTINSEKNTWTHTHLGSCTFPEIFRSDQVKKTPRDQDFSSYAQRKFIWLLPKITQSKCDCWFLVLCIGYMLHVKGSGIREVENHMKVSSLYWNIVKSGFSCLLFTGSVPLAVPVSYY